MAVTRRNKMRQVLQVFSDLMATGFKGHGMIFKQWIFTMKIRRTDADDDEEDDDDDDFASTSLNRSSCALSTK